jgi:hypothetical protein
MLSVGGWINLDDVGTYRHFSEFDLEFYFSIVHDVCREFGLRQTSTRDRPESIVDMMSEVLNEMYGMKIVMNELTCKLQKNTKFSMVAGCRTKPCLTT